MEKKTKYTEKKMETINRCLQKYIRKWERLLEKYEAII